MFFTPLETRRLRLRNIESRDRGFLFEQFSNREVCRYLFDNDPMESLEQADEIITLYIRPEPRDMHRWVLEEKESGKPVGTCGFHYWSGQEAEVGYDLHPDFWGRGYMAEAMEEILRFAKEEMKLQKIHAHIYTENKASIKLVKRFGFRFEGNFRQYCCNGETYPHYIYTYSIGGTLHD